MASYKVTNCHPSHTVAFGETIQHDSDENTNEAIPALITSLDEFPPLQSSASTAGKLAQDIREWQVILPRDADINEGLTISSGIEYNDTTEDDGFDNDKDTASDWQHVEYQKLSQSSFAEIAARAGEDHSPIPNERFFTSIRKHKNESQRSEKNAVKYDKSSASTTTQKQVDYGETYDHYCYGHRSLHHHYNVFKASRESVELRKHYALRRKQNTIEIAFRRRMRTLPETLARQENRSNKIRKLIQVVESKKKAAEDNLCPTVWNQWVPSLPWHGTSFSHIFGSKNPNQKGHKKKVYSNITKANLVRTQLLNGLIEHGMIAEPTAGKQTTLREEEERAIEMYARRIACRNHRALIQAWCYGKEWQYYGTLLIALQDILETRYRKMLNDLTYGYNEKGSDKAILKLLYKELPRCYYKPGNRKYRKQHVQFFVQKQKNKNEEL
ncbi:hypothetical protein BDB00DRAFT_801586 [Zychaea mexicana]|uniref:uncharacterized protein n=1 Tax=Zychaea mexicana TaxID=64656 RepID=UPI0022FEC5EC|nr:uncharacterized protein BDB00DRAFT_801586 [Zychaea mexicana]KAI9498204.1 hypothetical protein BDB00DRAFT_801586 [Zychaea mexicana]